MDREYGRGTMTPGTVTPGTVTTGKAYVLKIRRENPQGGADGAGPGDKSTPLSRQTGAADMIDRSDRLWFKRAIIYEAHVKAFFDANDDGVGDFAGFASKLDY